MFSCLTFSTGIVIPPFSVLSYELNHEIHTILYIFSVVTPSAIRPVDYTAVLNPCRPEDYLCSSKCVVMKMKGDFSCEFCVCSNKDYYGK